VVAKSFYGPVQVLEQVWPGGVLDKSMERYLPRIWIFVVAFCFGVSVTAAWHIYTLPVLPDLDIEPVVILTPRA
jgi:hypothetical protein